MAYCELLFILGPVHTDCAGLHSYYSSDGNMCGRALSRAYISKRPAYVTGVWNSISLSVCLQHACAVAEHQNLSAICLYQMVVHKPT